MEGNGGPLSFNTANPNRITAESGTLSLHIVSLLPPLQDIERELCINSQEQHIRSANLIRLLRRELDSEQADKVQGMLNRLGIQLQQSTPARGSTPSFSQDSETARAGSALLALREIASQGSGSGETGQTDLVKEGKQRQGGTRELSVGKLRQPEPF